MEKKLIAKTQKIVPKIPQYTSLFSNIVTSTPEDEEVLKKKGVVYGVFEVLGPIEFETSVISKTICDILQDSYFRSENISPVQSLEKAILDTKRKLTELNENTLKAKGTDLKLDIVAAVLWGNVLYVVQHGKGNAFIMREGETKPVSFMAEGNFSSASGIVKNDDVVIINTVSFGEKFPPDALLRANADTFSSLPPEASCLMIKFSVDTAFTKDEQIDFGLKKKKSFLFNLKAIRNKIRQRRPHNKEGIMSIQGARINLKGVKRYLIPIFLVAFIASIFFTVKNGLNKGPVEEKKKKEKEEIATLEPATIPTAKQDESFFYDIAITDSNATPTDILITDSKVVISDEATGKLYISDTATPQFSALEAQFLGAGNLVLKDNLINFKDKDGYKIYNLETNTITKEVPIENPRITYPYLDFIYEIDGDLLSKYTLEGEKSTWAQTPEFSDAVSMAIDVSIYILKGSGEVVKYTAGVKDEFELKGMDMALNKPVKIVLTSEPDQLYIADSGNQSIVITDLEGNFKQRIHHEDKWEDIKSISVSPSKEQLYVLSGTSVYAIDL